MNPTKIRKLLSPNRINPYESSLLRLVSAVLMETSEEWGTGGCCLDMNVNVEENEKSASLKKGICRKNVA